MIMIPGMTREMIMIYVTRYVTQATCYMLHVTFDTCYGMTYTLYNVRYMTYPI